MRTVTYLITINFADGSVKTFKEKNDSKLSLDVTGNFIIVAETTTVTPSGDRGKESHIYPAHLILNVEVQEVEVIS